MTDELDPIFAEIIADPTAYHAAQAASRDHADSLTARGERQRNDICRAIHKRIAKIRNLARWIGFETSQDEAEDAIHRAICKWSLKTPISKHDSAAGIISYLRRVAYRDLAKRRNEESRQAQFERQSKPATSINEDYRLDDISSADTIRNDEDVERRAKLEFHPKRFGDAELHVLYSRAIGVAVDKIAFYLYAESGPAQPNKAKNVRRLNDTINRIAEQMDELFGSDYRGRARQAEAIQYLVHIENGKREEGERQIAEMRRQASQQMRIKSDFNPDALAGYYSPACRPIGLTIKQRRFALVGMVALDLPICQ